MIPNETAETSDGAKNVFLVFSLEKYGAVWT